MCNLYHLRRPQSMTRNFEIVGIGPSTQEATLRPKKDLTMKKIELVGNSNGKLFLSLQDFNPDVPNIIGMLFNGKQVAIRKNENFMGTDTADQTEGRYKAYAFDVPMRFIEPPFPATFIIQFILGHMEGEKFIEETRSESFTLTITE